MADETFFDPSLFLNEAYVTKTYEFSGIKVELLELASTMTDHDLTGQVVWPAALVLVQHVITETSKFSGKEVLELGAGVGLTGLVTAHMAQNVVLSDYHDVVLKALGKNVEHSGLSNVACAKLRWGENLQEFKEEHGEFDILMGSDIVFWHDCIEPLFVTVDFLLKKSPESFFVTSYTSRATNTDRVHLYNTATKHGYVWEELPVPEVPGIMPQSLYLTVFRRGVKM